jgi:apolipoprotein N-acyltransferase
MFTHLAAITPRRRALYASLVGAVASLAIPPVGWFGLLWFCLPALYYLLQNARSQWQAFWLGWSFACGYFICGLYWIAAALLVDWQKFLWLVPITVTGLPALLAVYYGLAALAWHRLRLTGCASTLALALLLAAAEYARGQLFTGFPWNLFAYAWAEHAPLAQSFSLFGSYGVTLLILLAALLPAAWLQNAPHARMASLSLLGLCAGLWLWGAWRLQTPTPNVPDVYLRIVQPNIQQRMKWDKAEQDTHFQQLLTLSAAPASQPITHILWPETALTFDLTLDAARRAELTAALPTNSLLLTGMVRREANMQTQRWDYFNSLLVFDKTGMTVARYDKAHLVPFGEYVPLRGFAPVAAATAGLGSFKAGAGPMTLTVSGGLPPFSPLICYEVIFPGAVTAAAPAPRLLINITNDAWYGNTAGPYQHLAISRMRAIETGLPLLRAANTGISAVVDAYGRVLAKQPLNATGVIDSPVPQALAAPTLYQRYRDTPALIIWTLLAGWVLLVRLFANSR